MERPDTDYLAFMQSVMDWMSITVPNAGPARGPAEIPTGESNCPGNVGAGSRTRYSQLNLESVNGGV